MPTLFFVVPAHGRLRLARICLRQLRRTCDSLTANGIEANAVVIASDGNLDTAREFGFGTYERGNQFVSEKFNDGFQMATDPDVNSRPADFVIPIGSDDWIDWRIILPALPEMNEVVGFQHISFVREDGLEMTKTFLDYPGGCGMRIYPRQVLAKVGYRPADEALYRGCDTSILTNVRLADDSVKVMHFPTDPRSIVDWKTSSGQLNEYDQVRARHCRHSETVADPFDQLEDFFPTDALAEMQAHYSGQLVAA